VSKTVIVRYTTRPEAAEQNQELIEGVYSALAEARPADFQYATYRLADGVSFVHVAQLDGDENPLVSLPAFQDFQRDLPARCAEQPVPSGASLVGSYTPAASGAGR
jgi:hypothetical protein